MNEICPKKASETLGELMLNVSIKMKDRRRAMGASQNDLAYCIGSDKSVISSIERGVKTNVSLYMLVRISEALEITVEELIK